MTDTTRPQDDTPDDYDDYDLDDSVCPHCLNDGCDPDCDYLLPCPLCQGEQRP